MELYEYRGVGVARDFFCYVSNGIPAKKVSTSHVVDVSLVHGFQAQYPAVLLMVGIILVCFLLWPIFRLVDMFQNDGNPSSVDFLVGGVAVIGGWTIYEAFRRGWYLRLKTHRGAVKLAFDRGAEPSGLTNFAKRIQQEAGIPVSGDWQN
jgi:uncharacterized membrane protein YqjE